MASPAWCILKRNDAPMEYDMDRNKQGFSLIEVSLATMVVGIGILSVFALFPTGLNEAQVSQATTRCTQFSEEVFGWYGSIASTETNLTDWAAVFAASGTVGDGVSVNTSSGTNSVFQAVRYPDPNGTEWMQYKIYGGQVDGKPYCKLTVATKYGKVGGKQDTFFSAFFFHGM